MESLDTSESLDFIESSNDNGSFVTFNSDFKDSNQSDNINYVTSVLMDGEKNTTVGDIAKINEIKCACSCNLSCNFWCIQCVEFVCGICVEAHKRFNVTKSHQIEEVEQLTKTNATCNCSAEISYWCMDCLQFICKNCYNAHQRIKICRTHEMLKVDNGKTRKINFQLHSVAGSKNVGAMKPSQTDGGFDKDAGGEFHKVAVGEFDNVAGGEFHNVAGGEFHNVAGGEFHNDAGGKKIQKRPPSNQEKPARKSKTSGRKTSSAVPQETRNIDWIHSGRTFTIPEDLWNKIYVNNKIIPETYTQYKNKIGDLFDIKWKCMLILTHKNAGKNVITFIGKCKHSECRRYKLICTKKFQLRESATFDVLYSTTEVNHEDEMSKQLRGISRKEYQGELLTKKSATFQIDKIIEMDDDLHAHGNSTCYKSDSVIKKVRSEVILSQDLSKDDYDDMKLLQKSTNESGNKYISKVVSPYAVYIHSKEQYKVLHEMHKRQETVEIVGYLDATGGVVRVTPETSKHPILYYPLIVHIKGDNDDEKGVENRTLPLRSR